MIFAQNYINLISMLVNEELRTKFIFYIFTSSL